MGLVARRVRTLLARGRLSTQDRRPLTRGGEGSARLRVLHTPLGVRPHALVSGLFANRGEEARAWERPGVLLSSASCPYLGRRLWSLLLRVDREVSPSVGYLPLAEKHRRSARTARLLLRPSGDVTYRANRCATRVAYSS